MIPNVDLVDLWAIQELPALVGASLTTRFPAGNVASLIAGYLTAEDIANIIADSIGQAGLFPDRVYRIGVEMPEGSSVSVDNRQIIDPYLDGKVYSMNRRGLELSVKGLEWDNDVVGGGFSLLQEGPPADIFVDGDIITLQFQPQISSIISSIDSIARMSNGVETITSDTILSPATFRRIINIAAGGGSVSVTLNATYPENIGLFITTGYNTATNKQSRILTPGGQNFLFNNVSDLTELILGQNETLQLIRIGINWYVIQISESYSRVGNVTMGYLPGFNQIIGQGQTLLRTEYPRVLNFINALELTFPGSVKNSADWPMNRTCWGTGDGTTTIQVPDLRGYFPRFQDLGAGIDADRVTAGLEGIIGSGQLGDVESHNHDNAAYNVLLTINGQGTGTSFDAGGANQPDLRVGFPMLSYGGTETRPINVGLLPLINV